MPKSQDVNPASLQGDPTKQSASPKNTSAPNPEASFSGVQRRTAQAMIATYVQVSRSAQLAQWIQRSRMKKLERQAEQAHSMDELVRIQQQIDAQANQANTIDAATQRLRNQAPTVAQFLDSGLTLDDLKRLGVEDVLDPDELKRAVAAAKKEAS